MHWASTTHYPATYDSFIRVKIPALFRIPLPVKGIEFVFARMPTHVGISGNHVIEKVAKLRLNRI